jgi:N-acetyl-D-muramate 6-phosphate phosphatase
VERRFSGLQAVLFDLDGTLLDSAPDLGGAAESLRLARGLPPLPLELYRAQAGSGARGMLRVAFDMAPDHEDYAALREAFIDAYEARMLELTLPFDGVPALVDALNGSRMPWGVVTNKAERLTHPRHRLWRHHAPPEAPSRALVGGGQAAACGPRALLVRGGR